MPLKRKAHRKSRGGCQQCKRRRIKCDEERPQCGHCIRHEAQCIYLDPTTGRAPSSNPSASAHGSPTTPGDHTVVRSTRSPSDIPYVFVDDGITIPSGSYFNLRDMALMHHWTLLTSLSIVESPTLDHFWQTVYPEIAFQHAYVMHSILSITALHSIFLCPPKRRTHLCIATHHHTLALRGFREGIDSMGSENSEALFASATLIFFYAFLTFGNICIARGEDPGAAAPTSQILGADWIPLVRGMRAVLAPLREYIGNGPLSSLLSMGNFFELDPDKQPGPNDDRFTALRETWVSDSHATVYEEALKMLRAANAFMAQFEDVPEDQMPDVGYNRQWSGPFAWLFVCSHEYLILQQQRQPVAMVLFAYFGVLVAKLDQRGLWWAQGCGKSIVSAVQDVLGPFWIQWLSWPKQMVGLQ